METGFSGVNNNPEEFFRWLEIADEGALFSFISNWHSRGENAEELIKFIEFFRDKSPPMDLISLTNSVSSKSSYDCAGTGGDKSNSFNISTGTAFLAAFAGLPVIKNGGRSASSKVGSVDVLYEMGLNLDINDEKKFEAFQKLGLSFFSSKISSEYLIKVKNLARKHKTSCFINLIAPFLSPIELEGQMIGIAQARWIPVIKEIAKYFIEQGYRKKFILVHSTALDEFNTVEASRIIFLSRSETGVPQQYRNSQKNILEQEFLLDPHHNSLAKFKLKTATLKDLEGGDTEENANILIKIFQGMDSLKLEIKAETLALNTALMLLLKEDFSLFNNEESLLEKLLENYIGLKKILETSKLYEFLSELRKYFTK